MHWFSHSLDSSLSFCICFYTASGERAHSHATSSLLLSLSIYSYKVTEDIDILSSRLGFGILRGS